MAAPTEEASTESEDVAAFEPNLSIARAPCYPDAVQGADRNDVLSAKILLLPLEIRHCIFDHLLHPSLTRRAGLVITLPDNSTYEILLIQCKGFCKTETQCNCDCPPDYYKNRIKQCKETVLHKDMDKCTCTPHHSEAFSQSKIQRQVIEHQDVLQDPGKYFPQLSSGLLADFSVYLRQDAANRLWSEYRKTDLLHKAALLALATYLHYPGRTDHRKGRLPAQELEQSEQNLSNPDQETCRKRKRLGKDPMQSELAPEPDYWVHMRVSIGTPSPPLIRDSTKFLMQAIKQSETWLKRQRKIMKSKRIRRAIRRGHAVPDESEQDRDAKGNYQWVTMASASRMFHNCIKRDIMAKEDKQLQSWLVQLLDPNSVTNWVRWTTPKHEKLGVDELKEMLGGAKIELFGVHALSMPLPRITLTLPSVPEASSVEDGVRLSGRLGD